MTSDGLSDIHSREVDIRSHLHSLRDPVVAANKKEYPKLNNHNGRVLPSRVAPLRSRRARCSSVAQTHTALTAYPGGGRARFRLFDDGQKEDAIDSVHLDGTYGYVVSGSSVGSNPPRFRAGQSADNR
jgi:hypothetical protein